MALKGPHHTEYEEYRDEEIRISVYHDPIGGSGYSEVRVVFATCIQNDDIDGVSTKTKLNPSSIIPWINPEPEPMDEQIERTLPRIKERIDSYYERKEMALS